MKPFTQIAVPHDDIVQGRLTMDVYAADLWQVVNGKAPLDYQDPDLFFRKTYPTDGLKNILDVANARLQGKSGDSIIQLQTPFGGGKTHTLIALYHKAKEWNAKVVVIDGTALDPKEKKLWEEMERQLTGTVVLTKGDTAPGKEKLIELLSAHSPTLILMDELLEYITKSAGVKVGDSNLAAQSFAFIQELTGAVATVGNALLVLTLPSSVLEHYDESAERMFQQLQKIVGRMEKIYTPVKDDEIEFVVRARLFNKVDESEAKKIVDEFVEFAKNEGLLSGDEVSEYRSRFLKSYPFKPEVIDILYKRWGSFPEFQRTRGVLRLLSLVIYNLLDKSIPFIRLGDFDLSNEELRRELIKFIGQEWDSVIAQDITSSDAGAKKVDAGLGASYIAYKLGSVVSTTIFMMSFSGRGERGASVREIKLSTIYPEFTSSLIDTVITNLRERLFYLSDEGLYFTNQPNLNKILVTQEDNIADEDIYEEEKEILRKHISGSPKLRIFIHPKFSRDIPDTQEFKLIILNQESPSNEFLERYGESPRVYRNTLIFLCVDGNQREVFHSYLRKLLALRAIDSNRTLNLTDNQKNEVKTKLKSQEQREYEELRKYYRKLFLPTRDGFKEFDMGMATFGESQLDKEIYNYLKNQGELLERIHPKVIKDRYLGEKDYVEIVRLYQALLGTPGELRLLSKEALAEGIREGVREGLFGFGYLEEGKPECRGYKKEVNIAFEENEIILNPNLCEEEKRAYEGEKMERIPSCGETVTLPLEAPVERKAEAPQRKAYRRIHLKLAVPVWQISSVSKIANFLRSAFSTVDVQITIDAHDGELGTFEYENTIHETLQQSNIEIIEENTQ